MQKGRKEKPNILRAASALIVDGRFVIFLLFAAAVYCALSVGKVKVSSDLTAFLPADTETRRGLTVMEDEFVAYASANVMVSSVTYDIAESLRDEIAALEHVTDVAFDETTAHFVRASALLPISFDGGSNDPGPEADMAAIRELVEPYDHYISTAVGDDYTSILARELDESTGFGDLRQIADELFSLTDWLLERSGGDALFGTVTLTFLTEDAAAQTVSVPYGAAAGELPEVPDRGGKHWVWELDAAAPLTHSLTVEGRCVGPVTVLATGGRAGRGAPPVCRGV